MHKPHRILVLHEKPDQRAQIRQHLASAGYDVRAGADCDSIVHHADGWNPEVLVANYETNNSDLRRMFSGLLQAAPTMRFILLTPPGHTLEIMRSMRRQIAVYLSHNFSPEELVHYVQNLINGDTGGSNRREHNRYSFSMETHCVLINPFSNIESRPIAALVRDVSRSGVSLIVRQMLPVPSMLRLVMQANDQSSPVAMLAKSVSCMLTQIQGVYRVGLKFIGLLPSEMTDKILQLGSKFDGKAAEEDIYMGKSFAGAVREWLASHQDDSMLQPAQAMAELALELCRVECEHAPPDLSKNRGTNPPPFSGRPRALDDTAH